MQSSRLYPTLKGKRPKVILSKGKKFPFASDLQVGDIGQLDAVIEVEAIRLDPDETNVDVRMVTLKLNKANILNEKSMRIM